MKIKSISRTAPELYLITYRRIWVLRWLGCVERYVIVEPEEKISPFPDGGENCTITKIVPFFYFRDSDELAHNCWHQIEWMIRNDVEFFDNFPSAYQQVRTLFVENFKVPNKPGYQPSPLSKTKPDPPAKPPEKL